MEDKQVLPETAPLEVTFGFELEFIVLSVPDQFLDPELNDPRQVYGITRPIGYPNEFLPYLNQPHIVEMDGIPEIIWPEEWYLQFNALKRGMAELLTENKYPAVADCDKDEATDDSSIKSLDRWIISMDQTVSHGTDPFVPNYYWWPMEIQSPAYIYNEENKKKVRDVLKCITKNYRTRCDLSADIHVHIGNGENGFDIRTIRNLMAFVWSFENHIATIHPPHYVSEDAFSRPLSTHSYLAVESQLMREKLRHNEDLLESHDRNFVIDHIMSLDTVDKAVIMLSAKNLDENRLLNRLAYSICNLETDMEKIKKTIEFRQHKSTLDDEEVYHWITVCRSLVYFASIVDEELLIAFCKEHIKKLIDEFSIVQVLMAINRPAQAYYYGLRVAAETRKRKEEELRRKAKEERMREHEEEQRKYQEAVRRQDEEKLKAEKQKEEKSNS